VGTLPVGCAVSYDASDDVIYLLWQQSPDSLDSTQFQDAFEDFETAAEVVQDHLRGEISETTGVSGEGAAQNMVLKV
ncbi:MAG: hypothetical protein IJJ26_04225, partial [Victivallales bacterium]|nr:hypothetical protein [Victivallales bacterium]